MSEQPAVKPIEFLVYSGKNPCTERGKSECQFRWLPMVSIIRTDKKGDYCKVGIHLYRPSKRKIEDAWEDAINKNFRVIYIHGKSCP